jgi:amino acid adenylation domain-containing protein/non-ribosomal peptide synthase protein (TIGR01720 family)
MSSVLENVADLSPEKRALLEMLLKEQGVNLSRSVILPQSRDTNTFPLSFAQQRLWFLDQLEPGSPMYNIPSAVRLTGRLDVAALERSIAEIVRRHEALRTTFAAGNGQPVQVIAPELAFFLPILDLRSLPELEQEAEALRLATKDARQPFDLTAGPLLRATLLRLDEKEHVVLLNMHHIISDGWSIGVLIAEIAMLYQAFSTGEPSPLPRLPIQYADFACWQRNWLQGDVLETQLNYWKEQLGDDPPVLGLATDRPRPAVQTYRGASQRFELPGNTSKAIKALSQEDGNTLFMTLLAAFQVLLYRYTGQDDISVGTPIANRNRSEIEGLIGFFVNTLVMRADLSGNPSFKELLERVREVTLGAYAHQDLPFEMLVEELRPERTLSYSPLFQVMFILQNAPVQARQLPELTLSPLEVHSNTAKFDLTLTVVEDKDRLHGMLEYNADLFDAPTIRRMLKHFQRLLEGIAGDSQQPISDLPLLTEAERHLMLDDWNDTRTDDRLDQCIHHLVEAQAARMPDAVALVFERQRLSYRELNARANQLAHHLRAMGVGPGRLVGVCMERSPEMVVGLLGILKAGGAYVPLDPKYPQERLVFMMQDAQVSVLLTQGRLLETLPDYEARVVCVDDHWAEIAQHSDANLDGEEIARDLAYVLFTSGSTGRPKGVAIEHRSATALIRWARRVFAPGELAGVLASTSISFDLSVFELFVTLSCGNTVILAENALQLPDLAAADEVTLVNTVPSAIAELLRSDAIPGSVQTVNLAGEPLLAHLVDGLYERPSVQRVYDLYGPSEDTTYSTFARRRFAGPEIIGHPVGNTRAYVLDKSMQPAPIGVPGELYLGGAGLARGYLNRPELTAEKFVPDPWGDEPDGRLYRTGDLVRYGSDGNLEFLGRMDHQVKIRGFRIELGEIEAVLRGHEALKDVVVLARDAETAPSDKRLVAYLVPTLRAESQDKAIDEGPLTPDDLRSYVRQTLPDYMVPSAFVWLDEMPLTPNGKVNRRALPAPDWSRRDLQSAYVAPRTPVEEMLANIYAQLLGVERVSVRDSFFDLGGHSLLATQLVSRLREFFQLELPLRELFEATSVAELADRVVATQQAGQGRAAPPIEGAPRDGDLPLSFAQQRLWFLDQLEPGNAFYNIPDAVRISGPLDVAALEQSLNEIVRRHEVLRTTFPTVNGKARQVIAPELRISLSVEDLTGLAELEAQVLRLATQEFRRPFDLARGPLIRVRLLRLDEAEHVVLLTMHHIVSDGWSTGVLTRELALLYRAFDSGESAPLPDLPIQYADFAYWQRNWLQGEVLEAQLNYWRQQLAGLPPLLELPTDRPRPAFQTHRGASQPFMLPQRTFDLLKTLSREQGTTLFMTLLAAFQTLLYRYTGQPDISVGTPIANRNRGEIEGLIGFFINTLVMRADLSDEPSFRELLKQVREVALEAYAHQDVPFEMLVDELQPERDMSHTPLFQVMFALQNVPMEVLELPDLTLSSVEIKDETAKFDLTLTMVEGADGLRGSLEYNTDLFDASTMARMLEHFRTLLEGIVATKESPDRPISKLPLLTQAERQQLLGVWNKTAADYPRDQSIHLRFEAQVTRTPDVVAVVAEEKALTFAELNRRANQVARYVQKLGVGPEQLVGLCVERSLETVLGVMGILKAGAAYLPLDPSYPRERLAFMLQDAQASVLLTQQALVGDLPTEGVETVCLDADWERIARENDRNPEFGAGPDNLAYIIYTSGSTGKPKGAMIQHRSALHLAAALQRVIYTNHPGAPLRLSLNAPLPFDASVQQLVMLTYGHTLCVIPQDARLDGEALLAYVRRNRLDVLDCVPSQLKLLLAAGLLDGAGWVPAAVLPGGEAIDEETWRALAEAPATEFYNMYGPTECAVDSTIAQVKAAGERPTIGGPVPNARLYILDRCLQPVPIGVLGELHIGGAGVGRGYLSRPRLTAEKFLPDPFGDEPGARLYRTGDLVRYLPGGNVEFLGRIDHQVKVRGFRMELGEIEAVLKEHPHVQESVVLAREDVPGDKRLVAYLVPDGHKALTVSELRRFLKGKLPEYMVPSAYVTLDALPLLPNAKVNRRALPAPDQSRPDLEVDYVAANTDKEQILADIWAQVLGVERVGVYDNFFELGGDSILSIQVISYANQAGLQLTPKQLFQHPTVAGLAAVAGTGPSIQAEQGIVEGPVLLTPIQHWFFERDLPEPHYYNQALLLQVRQTLEPELLEMAVAHLMAHHDALRLRFERVGESMGGRGELEWEQVNAGVDGKVPFEWVDLSQMPEAEQGAAIERRASELQASLNLAEGPLFRVAYSDLGAGRAGRLLIVVHHLAMDGVSWRILLEDLQTAYGQLAQGKEVQLPLKTTSFQDWAQRLSEYAQTGALRDELPHWRSVGQRWIPRLPLDYPGAFNTEASARSVTVSLDERETQALLQEVSAAYRTEINDALLTALTLAMSRWAGSAAVLVDLEGHGREDIFDDVDVSRTLGWFTAIYPVVLDLSATPAGEPGEALKAVKEQLRQVPNRGIGYGLLRYLCQDGEVAEHLRALPQAEVAFNYLGQFDQALPEDSPFGPARESRGSDRSARGERSYVLEINGGVAGGRLGLEWVYSENLHRRGTIERLAHDFIETLRVLIDHCLSPQAGGVTPADFGLVNLDQKKLDKVLAKLK